MSPLIVTPAVNVSAVKLVALTIPGAVILEITEFFKTTRETYEPTGELKLPVCKTTAPF